MATASSSLTTTEIVRRSLRGKRLDLGGLVFEGALLLALLLSLLLLVVLLADVIRESLPVFQERPVGFLTGRLTIVSASIAGVSQGISGSLLTLVFVVLVAIPLGIGAAVYLEEYAQDTALNRLITVNIRNLAGVPSIVYGLLGLAIFLELMGGVTGGPSIITAGLTLAVLVLPIVIITASEALRAVPDSIREAGFGVGATRWEVIRSHVLPSAAPGILTGTILALSRAVGETAPLLLVGAVTGLLATGGEGFIAQLFGRYTTLPTIVYRWARLPQDDFRVLTAAAIVVLLALTLSANAIAIFLRNRYERKW